MALPSYTNDLTTIAIGDINVDAGTWDESSNAGWDTAGAMVDDLNLYYTDNGAIPSCVSAQYTKDGIGSGTSGPGTIMYEHTAAFTVPTNGVVIAHHLWAAPAALNSVIGTPNTAEAGISVLVGDSLGVFDVFYVSGSDAPPAPEGGWATYTVDPALTPDNTVGTSTTTTMVGVAVAAVAQARGNPQAVQAVRYGRADSIYTLGELANPATFSGFALIDNAPADRFNLLKNIEGGYKAQGLISLGTAATAVYFDDANKNISLADNPKVSSVFNAIEVNNALSEVHWTAIGISALGIVSKGSFTMVDNATVNKTSCTFTDMDTFTYLSGVTSVNSIYRRCGLITQGSGTFTGCTIDRPTGTVGMAVNALNSVTKCTFNSDGTGHAVDMGTISADISYNWDNFESNYATVNGATGNETIVVSVNTGITLTINVATGASTPTIKNDGLGTVNVVSGQVTTLITVKDISTGLVIEGARVYLVGSGGALDGVVIFNTLTDVNGQVSDTRSLAADQAVAGRVRKSTITPLYKTVPINETISSANGLALNVSMIRDD